jgi:serine phosphatase RsbU (regulator of sigma subunit)
MGLILRSRRSGQARPLHEGENTVGRRSSADIVLTPDVVSKRHAVIRVNGEHVGIEDVGSHNGTFLDGKTLRPGEVHAIRPGNEIRFANLAFTLENDLETTQPDYLPESDERTAQLTWEEPISGTGDMEIRSRMFETLSQLGEFLVTDYDASEVYDKCLDPVEQLFDFDLACLLLVDESGQAQTRSVRPRDAAAQRLAVSRTWVDTVIRERRIVLVQTPFIEEGDSPNLHDSARIKGIKTALVVPLFDNKDVIGALYIDRRGPGRGYRRRHRDRLVLVSNLIAAKISNARTKLEMIDAGEIQRTLLGRELAHPDGWAPAARHEPSALVGGDLYAGVELANGKYLYALGDVSGHGVPAALLMANALASIRALAMQTMEPLALVERLKELLARELEPHSFVTLCVAIVDPQAHRLDYVNAGHEPPALLLPGEPARQLESTGPPVGLPIPVPLEGATAPFPPGALIAVWSDGIPESLRRTPNGIEDFGRENVVRLLEELRELPANAIVAGLFEAVDSFLSGTRAQDDRTLLVLRHEG